MTEPPYYLELDVAARTLCLRFAGLWTHLDVDDFQRDMDHALGRYRALGGLPGTLLILSDIRNGAIQRQEIAARLQAGIQRHSREAERIATVLSSSALQRAQTKRVTHTPNNRYFSDEAAAMAWLKESRTDVSQTS